MESKNIFIFNLGYALFCNETYINAIDINNITLSTDRNSVLNGDIIPVDTNLLVLSNSGIVMHSLSFGIVEFRFTETFFTNAKLENGNYNFTFNGITNDNVNLNTNKLLLVDL